MMVCEAYSWQLEKDHKIHSQDTCKNRTQHCRMDICHYPPTIFYAGISFLQYKNGTTVCFFPIRKSEHSLHTVISVQLTTKLFQLTGHTQQRCVTSLLGILCIWFLVSVLRHLMAKHVCQSL